MFPPVQGPESPKEVLANHIERLLCHDLDLDPQRVGDTFLVSCEGAGLVVRVSVAKGNWRSHPNLMITE